LWNVRSERQIGAPLRGHTDSVHNVAFSPNGWLLGSGSYDKTIRLWDIRTHRQIAKPLRDPSPVRGVAFSPSGAILVSGDQGYVDSGSGGTPSTVRLWDIAQIIRPRGHVKHENWPVFLALIAGLLFGIGFLVRAARRRTRTI
jgi:WD40 repeat protein